MREKTCTASQQQKAEPSKCPLRDEHIHELWCVHKIKFYTVAEMKVRDTDIDDSQKLPVQKKEVVK